MLNFKQLFENENMTKEVEVERDRILDKISQTGLDSLSQYEKDFLDSFKTGDHNEFYHKSNNVFEDDYFRFTLKSIEDYDGEEGGIRLRGDMFFKESNHELSGSIVETSSGQIVSSFRVDEETTDYDIVDPEDFGYYEDFLSYVIDELRP